MSIHLQAPHRVLVTPRSLTQVGPDGARALATLRSANYVLVSPPPGETPSEDELVELVAGCVGWVAGVEPITERVLAAATSLRVISRNGAGVDNIELGAAESRGIHVLRAPGANAQGVAELALALALDALRGVTWSAEGLRGGEWRRRRGRELPDLTVGVVGLGAVGRRVAAAFAALGASVVGHDPYAQVVGIDVLPLDALVARADILTLHSPPAADGRPLVDSALLSQVRHGAVLINTARASLVDDDAVLAALESGQLSGYAVDAFRREPPEVTALLRHERTIATPHLGGYTDASVRRAGDEAIANLIAALAGEGQRR